MFIFNSYSLQNKETGDLWNISTHHTNVMKDEIWDVLFHIFF